MIAVQVLSGIFLAAAVWGQAPTQPMTPDQQPDTPAMAVAARNLLRAAGVPDDVKSQADRLLTESAALQAGGQAGEMRRKVANALTLLNGRPWDPKTEFAWSLVLRPDTVVGDSSAPLIARISQVYGAPFRPARGLKLRASLVSSTGKPDAAGVRPIGDFEMMSVNLVSEPFGFDADLTGVADGAYRLRAELFDGDEPVAALEEPVQLVQGIATGRESIERRLARIQGHDGTKASIRYPYVLAGTVNVGRRRLNAADFGIPFEPHSVPYDFAQGVRRSAELLKALESGKDLLWRAKGDHTRHYWFEEAREMMPYRLYVPQKWDGRSRLPMVLVLHGSTRDENFYFDRDGGILTKMAEQHGYLVVCPLGYRPSAGWGSVGMGMGTSAAAGRFGRGGAGMANPAARQRQNELSEKDGLNVLELVQKEYPIDPSRIYLFGHSMGGAGAWYLGQKFPERWAAVAASASGVSAAGFQGLPYERLKGVPLMVIVGDQDPALNTTRLSVNLAREHGLDPHYVEMPGATHETIVAIIEPQVFDFFDQHSHR